MIASSDDLQDESMLGDNASETASEYDTTEEELDLSRCGECYVANAEYTRSFGGDCARCQLEGKECLRDLTEGDLAGITGGVTGLGGEIARGKNGVIPSSAFPNSPVPGQREYDDDLAPPPGDDNTTSSARPIPVKSKN
jgi:hypothetical protein